MLRCIKCLNLSVSARYQTSMLRSLREVQSDDSIVGFYQSTTLGAFFSQTLVESLATQRDKLRRGGVVIVHGQYNNHSPPRKTCLYN